ncbi:MAG TPA: hypothetical protein VMT20_24510 [Terriglobia bacterium]|nr:hypothetical protein [Terriglobia bacterium]
MSDQHRLQSVSFNELAISNMLKLNALVELLDEKGLLGKQEVLERVKRLTAEMAEKRKAH